MVDRVLVEELLPIAREFYTSILLDRSAGDYLAMMTAEGGIDIETLARERPEALRRVHVDPMLGMRALSRAHAGRNACPPTRATKATVVLRTCSTCSASATRRSSR